MKNIIQKKWTLPAANGRRLSYGTSGGGGGGQGDGNDGLIVSNYASFDPDANSIISFDINSTLPNWANSGGAIMRFNTAETWWSGTTNVVTMHPPTTSDQGSGLGEFILWKNATKAIRQLNFRFEWYCSNNYCLNSTTYPKFVLTKTHTEFQSIPTLPADRPMFFLENMTESGNGSVDIADTIQFAPAQGTLRMYSRNNITPAVTSAQWVDGGPTGPATYCSMPQPFYVRATSGTDGYGNPIIAASEIICIEMRVNVMATTDEPNGVIGMRVYRRSGAVYERCCAWTWDGAKTVDTNYFRDIEQFGGGYYNVGQASSPDLWTKVGRRCTIGMNLSPTVGRYWMGPPEGFVQ